MKKVVKFGGSSLASAAQFKKVGDIIRKDPSRRYVVPSAPGKRFKDDTKVTDMLDGCYAAAVKEKKFTEQLEQMWQKENLHVYTFAESADGTDASATLHLNIE